MLESGAVFFRLITARGSDETSDPCWVLLHILIPINCVGIVVGEVRLVIIVSCENYGKYDSKNDDN